MANEYLLNIAASMQLEVDKLRAMATAGEHPDMETPKKEWTEIRKEEIKVFRLVALGLTTKEIAHMQGKTIRSIDNLRYGLQDKIRAKNTSHAVALLYQAKILR